MKLPKPILKRCVVCGSARKNENNHPGGRNFLPLFTMPYCQKDHAEFHEAVRQAGIDLNHTNNPLVRFVRGMKMLLVAAYQLVDRFEQDIQRNEE